MRYLRECTNNNAGFRPQQWEAIDRLANNQERLLIVQRTGWGKSIVYFIATKALRDHGAGPTMVVSPLLSLMRNQINDAEADLGLHAVTINSNNTDEWADAKRAVKSGECDLLLVSPERLANREFREEVLDEMEQEIGMLVIDEAHCISDWGHDFRPDYRRIRDMVERLPDYIPIAATTATANDRVVNDITEQLPGMMSLRGPLMRESLKIQTLEFDEQEQRLAWLAENVSATRYSGIIYCLTHEDVQDVATWLQDHGVDVLPYHGGMHGERREQLEAKLMDNEIDALVATNALGMGFNKPDLGYVIHYQRPPNLIRYYQEIGRAGRDLNEAYAFVLSHDRDDEVARYFIENSFPDPEDFEQILDTIEASDEPLHKRQLLKLLNLSYTKIDKCLSILRVDGALDRLENGFVRTGEEWIYDDERYQKVTEERWRELTCIQEFISTDACLMQFIATELDAPLNEPCGQCANCDQNFLPETIFDDDLIEKARVYYRDDRWQIIEPRRQLPEKHGTFGWIPDTEQLEPGRALARYNDPGWGELVQHGRTERGRFNQELIESAVNLIETTWDPSPEPEWVTAIPSTSVEGLVTDAAERIATKLELPYDPIVEQVEETAPQADLANSYQQCWNVQGAFEVTDSIREGPVLLVDDVFGSRWTLTEVGRTLQRAGSGPVLPFAFAERQQF
ncbi:RecQ family ATP-dependent DNA helicase [Halovenus marina]|uniref:RecQ family ATP-dependent DNA helicase n=1 Tax=Halovenus marina TaxID=3396621 RepID=UPI003F565DF1